VTANRGWKRRFEDPIPLPRGRQLVTLEDAARYIQKLPKAEQRIEEWQTAVEVLILVAESNGGPTMMARTGVMQIESSRRARVQSRSQRASLGKAEAEEGPVKTVLIYVDTSKDVGDVDHLKVFANEEAAEKWFAENDPEGVAFEYEVLE
jgi:hypothetical protein